MRKENENSNNMMTMLMMNIISITFHIHKHGKMGPFQYNQTEEKDENVPLAYISRVLAVDEEERRMIQ